MHTGRIRDPHAGDFAFWAISVPDPGEAVQVQVRVDQVRVQVTRGSSVSDPWITGLYQLYLLYLGVFVKQLPTRVNLFEV